MSDTPDATSAIEESPLPVNPVDWFSAMPTGGGTQYRRPTPAISHDPVKDWFRRAPNGGTSYVAQDHDETSTTDGESGDVGDPSTK